MNPKLEAITQQASDNFCKLVADASDDILKSWDAVVEEAQLQESKPKFRLGFTLTLDLDANRMESALTFGVRRKLTADDPIPDPAQLPLALSEDATTVTMTLPGKTPVTVPFEKFTEAADRVLKKSKK